MNFEIKKKHPSELRHRGNSTDSNGENCYQVKQTRNRPFHSHFFRLSKLFVLY